MALSYRFVTAHIRTSIAERFWEKVNKDGPTPSHCPELGPCWVWTSSQDYFGYGGFSFKGRTELAHRVSWWLATGTWPDLCVLHRCDNPSCVRPSHLFQGTQAANNADMMAKGRHFTPFSTPGFPHRCKLSAAQIIEIRSDYRRGSESGTAVLGLRFGVSPSLISRIVLSGKRA